MTPGNKNKLELSLDHRTGSLIAKGKQKPWLHATGVKNIWNSII